jgi:hypothetical protein
VEARAYRAVMYGARQRPLHLICGLCPSITDTTFALQFPHMLIIHAVVELLTKCHLTYAFSQSGVTHTWALSTPEVRRAERVLTVSYLEVTIGEVVIADQS